MYGDKRSLRSIRPTRARRPFDASVDHTDARKATVRRFGRSHRSAQGFRPCSCCGTYRAQEALEDGPLIPGEPRIRDVVHEARVAGRDGPMRGGIARSAEAASHPTCAPPEDRDAGVFPSGPSPTIITAPRHLASAWARLAEPLQGRPSEPQRAALAPRSVTRSSPRMSPDAAEVLNADDSPRPDLTP